MSNRILFVEDDTLIRLCTSELLREEGFDVVEAESGDTAADVLETQSFDILVTDVRMPGSKDGFDLAAHARQSNPTLPIVVITGYANSVGIRIRELGQYVALVAKPFKVRDLTAAMLWVAEQKRAHRPAGKTSRTLDPLVGGEIQRHVIFALADVNVRPEFAPHTYPPAQPLLRRGF